MGKRITCKTCGLVWTDSEAYMKDKVRCGQETCPHKRDNAKAKAKVAALFNKKKKEPVHVISTDTVRSKIDPSKVDHIYYEVPKVIITHIRMK